MILTDAEQRFLSTQRHGRLATVGPDGTPQVKPVGFTYNTELGTIDITGFNMAGSAKYRNIRANPRVAFVADDNPVPDDGAAGVRFREIRGTAEPATAAPDGHLSQEIIRIRPRRVIAFNVDPDRPGLDTRDIGADPVYQARWPE